MTGDPHTTPLDLENLQVLGTPRSISLYDELARTALIVMGNEHDSARLWSARWSVVGLPDSGFIAFSWEISITRGDPHCFRPDYDLTVMVTLDGTPFELDLAKLRAKLKELGNVDTKFWIDNGLRVMYPERVGAH